MLTIMPHFGISFQSFATIFFFSASHILLILQSEQAMLMMLMMLMMLSLTVHNYPFFLSLESHTLSVRGYGRDV